VNNKADDDITDSRDPCAEVKCYFGAQCVASADLLTGTCQCSSASNDTTAPQCSPDEPVCGDDMRDYRNICELRTASCERQQQINVKFHGRCGTHLLTYCARINFHNSTIKPTINVWISERRGWTPVYSSFSGYLSPNRRSASPKLVRHSQRCNFITQSLTSSLILSMTLALLKIVPLSEWRTVAVFLTSYTLPDYILTRVSYTQNT